MYRYETMTRLAEGRVVAIVREGNRADGRRVATLLSGLGFPALEVTATTPGAYDIVEELCGSRTPVGTPVGTLVGGPVGGPVGAPVGTPVGTLVGVGTVLSASQAVDAAQAGAYYVVTPNCCPEVIQSAHRHGLAALVGCATPTEIVTALQAGADAIKVFPADTLGPQFLTAVHGPLPWAPLVPVGGVTVENARTWLDHGAVAVALGSGLTKGTDDQIAGRVRQLLANTTPPLSGNQ